MNNIHPLFPEEEAENRFDEFWAVCPLKKKKAATQAKYNAVIAPSGHHTRTFEKDSGGYIDIYIQATEQDLIDGMRKYAKSVAGNSSNNYKRSEYILHSRTWLNQGRWLDE